MNRQSQTILRAVKLSCIIQGWTHVLIQLSKPGEGAPRSGPSRKLWTLGDNDMSRSSKRTALVQLIVEGAGGGAGVYWKLSVLMAQLCCEPNTALRNKVY